MSERFFRDGLERGGITALVPEPESQQRMNQVIYQELCRGENRHPLVNPWRPIT